MVSARTRQNNVSFGVVVALCLQITKVLPIFVSMAEDLDLLVLGHRIRFARRQKGATLADVSELVGRPVPYLSQLENGKVEPKLGLLQELADALGTTATALLDDEAPDRRAYLEIELERAQRDPAYQALGLGHLKPSAKVPDEALEHLVTMWHTVRDRPSGGGDQRGPDLAERAALPTTPCAERCGTATILPRDRGPCGSGSGCSRLQRLGSDQRAGSHRTGQMVRLHH